MVAQTACDREPVAETSVICRICLYKLYRYAILSHQDIIHTAAPRSHAMTMPDKSSRQLFQELAFFRHRLRKFLRFSERAARECGITPQQHQLMLGIAGFTGTGNATISQIAEFLQERHNSVVGLIDRAVQSGLVERAEGSADRRVVVVSLTEHGEQILSRLSVLHRAEVRRLRQEFLRAEAGEDKPGRTGRKRDQPRTVRQPRPKQS